MAGRDEVAGWLGIPIGLLKKWQERYETFPAPDYIISSRKGDVYGWRYGRKTEIISWPQGTRELQRYEYAPDAMCIEDGCQRVPYAKNKCRLHYTRDLRASRR